MYPHSLKITSQVLPRLFAGATVAVSLLLVSDARANLLNPANEIQLEAWLGQGDLNFTNIFTRQAGHNTLNFHAAVDGKGPTFTLMNIYGAGVAGGFDIVSQVVGGYNPQSWSSRDRDHMTLNDADRTAFIYNLTTGTLQRQTLGNDLLSSGERQTYNHSDFGPAFGSGGSDLGVVDTADLNFSLEYGHAFNVSYGGTPFGGPSIVAGTPNVRGISFNFFVGEIEVYTFAPVSAGSAVPDTAGTFGLLSVSLLGLAVFRRAGKLREFDKMHRG